MSIISIDSNVYLSLLELGLFIATLGVNLLATESFKFSAWCLAKRGHGVPMDEFGVLIQPWSWLKKRLVPTAKILALLLALFTATALPLIGNGHTTVVIPASAITTRQSFAPSGVMTDLRCFLRRRSTPRNLECATETGKRFQREFESLIDRSSRLLTWSFSDRVTVDPTIQTPEGVEDTFWTGFHRGPGGIFTMNKAIALNSEGYSAEKEMIYEHGLPSPVLEGVFAYLNVTSNPCGIVGSILTAGHGEFLAKDAGGQGTKRLYEARLPSPFSNIVARMRYAVILQADAFFFSGESSCNYSFQEAWGIFYEFYLTGSDCVSLVSEFGVLPHVEDLSFCLMSGTGYILASGLTGTAEPDKLTILSDGLYTFTAWSGRGEKEPDVTDVIAENLETEREILYAPYINFRTDTVSEEGLVGNALMQASQWLGQYSMAQRQVPVPTARVQVSGYAIGFMAALGVLAVAGFVVSLIPSNKDLVPTSALEGMRLGALDAWVDREERDLSGRSSVTEESALWGICTNEDGTEQRIGVVANPVPRVEAIPLFDPNHHTSEDAQKK